MTARAVLCSEIGDPKTWRIVEKEKPRASAGEVLVRMVLRPINPADVLGPQLFCSHFGPNRVVTGSEGVGFVEEVGENVTTVAKGQRVVPWFSQFYEKGNGSWQEYLVFPEEEVFAVPDSITDETAAQLYVNPWTVYGLLEDQKLSKGDYLVQAPAGSALGRQVIQLAKHHGIKTINIVRRDDLKEELKKLGADEVLNSSTEDVVARVKEITGGKMAAGAIDTIAGKVTQTMASCVRDGGKLFVAGALGSPDLTATINIFDFSRIQIKWWSAFDIINRKTPKVLAHDVTKLVEQGVIQLSTAKIFKLEEFQEAILEDAKSGRSEKILLRS